MRPIRGLLFAGMIGCLVLAPARANAGMILWYNGDLPANGGGTVNEQANNPIGALNTFDDFVVTDAAGWTIDTLWSNNQMDLTGIAQATWAIRSGVSVGNAGTLVAGGTAAATETATGRTGGATGFPEYTIEITGLNLYLAPGTYWLSVSPVVGAEDGSGGLFHSYNSATTGLNSINRPPSSIGNGLFNSTYLGYNFANFGNDYSMGVAGGVGNAVPEPSTMVMGGMGGLCALGYSGWRRMRTKFCV